MIMVLFFKNRITTLAAVVACFLGTFAASNIQASDFTPANFGSNGFAGFEISRNDIPGGTNNIIIPCQVIIEINGVPSSYNCTTTYIDKHRVFLSAVINAIPRHRFVPATVDGELVRVLMDFTVIFVCKEGACANTVARNHLKHYQKYGLSYVAPQPILSEDDWYDGFDNKLSWSKDLINKIDDYAELSDRKASASAKRLFSRYYPGHTISAEVDTTGAGADIEVTDDAAGKKQSVKGSRLKRSANDEADSFTHVSFIPGFYKGSPEPMRLFETTMARVEAPPSDTASRQVQSPDPTGTTEAMWQSTAEGRYNY